MKARPGTLSHDTRRLLAGLYARLDYRALESVYCDEGGDKFWRAKRGPCLRLGSRVAVALRRKLRKGGRSLYVGAGVAELPALAMETVELRRTVEARNLRKAEVAALNRACRAMPFTFQAADAAAAKGRFDHLWIVSVLNDPERFPLLSDLSYGRGDPLAFDPAKFARERRAVRLLVARCMGKLTAPGLVTTTAEEVPWVAEWCHRHGVPCRVGRRGYPTALVGDPVCFVDVGRISSLLRL